MRKLAFGCLPRMEFKQTPIVGRSRKFVEHSYGLTNQIPCLLMSSLFQTYC